MNVPVTAFLKPATPGLRVTFPGSRDALPEDGARVALSNYWRERIREGSVVIVEQKSEVPSAAAPAAAPAKSAPRTKKD